MAMTPRRRRFVEEYLVDLNARAAARRTGFSETSGGCKRLMKDPDVLAAIAAAMAERSRRTRITADAVLAELGRIGFANMLDYMSPGEDGDLFVDLKALDRDKAAAIAEVVVEDFKDGRTKDAREVRRVKFKLLDKRAALVDLGKHLGMFGGSGAALALGADGEPVTRIELSGPADE
jgi:phage terminase small subunit